MHFLEGLLGGLGIVSTCYLIPRLFVGDATSKQRGTALLMMALFIAFFLLSLESIIVAAVSVVLGAVLFLIRRRQHKPDIVVKASLLEDAISPELEDKLKQLEAEARAQADARESEALESEVLAPEPPAPAALTSEASVEISLPSDEAGVRRRRHRRPSS